MGKTCGIATITTLKELSATLGGGIAIRVIRSKMVANKGQINATSAKWNVTNLECRVRVD